MPIRPQMNERGVITRYKDTDTGEVLSVAEYERRVTMHSGSYMHSPSPSIPHLEHQPPVHGHHGIYSSGVAPIYSQTQQQYPANQTPANQYPATQASGAPAYPAAPASAPGTTGGAPSAGSSYASYPPATAPNPAQTAGSAPVAMPTGTSPLVQPGAQLLGANGEPLSAIPGGIAQGQPPTAGQSVQKKNLRMEGVPDHHNKAAGAGSAGYRTHGFLDATSVAILLPTLVLLALIIAAAHKKRLFPWQTIRTFNPPSGLMGPRDYERSFVCPPNLRRHGRMGKRNPNATWTEEDGIVLPFGFLARTHLPITIPLGRLPNKNMFLVAPSGSGKTTLMRAIMKAMLAKPCVMIALEAKANDPTLDEKKEGFKHTVLPEAKAAGFDSLYFSPLDPESIHWNPLDLDPTTFSSSIVQDVNSLPPEEQHWAERDHGYISNLVKLLKWGAVQVINEDENGQAIEFSPLPCNPRGLMKLVNNRRNIVESIRKLKAEQAVDPTELNELTLTLSSIIRTDTDWDKNIQGVRGRLRMFRNESVLRVTEQSNVDIRASMNRPTVLIFGTPASLGPDAESLAACFVYQLQQALHTRYGTRSVLPLFAFFDEYQTLNIDLAGRLSAIVRGANGGLAVILQNVSQIAKNAGKADAGSGGASELRTIFSNSAIRVCLHNADETTAKFFSEEVGKHAVVVPGISDHYESNGFGIFPTSWNRIHSQQVVSRVDTDSIKRMEKHHALVYLSPAGDPEFGETKPFMCDLRGIEEIARMHLLHNVSGKTPPDGSGDNSGSDNGSGGAPLPIGPMPIPGGAAIPPVALDALARETTQAVSQAVLSTSAKILRPEPQKVPVAGPAEPPRPPMPIQPVPAKPQPPQASQPRPGVQAPQAPVPVAKNQQPPLPNAQRAPLPAQPVPSRLLNGQGQGQNRGPETAQRICPHCHKSGGKGRFCIECGKFLGQNSGVPTNIQASGPTNGQLAANGPQAGTPQNQGGVTENTGRPQFPGNPAPPSAMAKDSARQPLTSLHQDLAKYGLPQGQTQGQPQAQTPGQAQGQHRSVPQNAPGAKPKPKSGIEF